MELYRPMYQAGNLAAGLFINEPRTQVNGVSPRALRASKRKEAASSENRYYFNIEIRTYSLAETESHFFFPLLDRISAKPPRSCAESGVGKYMRARGCVRPVTRMFFLAAWAQRGYKVPPGMKMAGEKLMDTGDGVAVGRAGERRAQAPALSWTLAGAAPVAQHTARTSLVSSARQKQRPQESAGALHVPQVVVERCSPPRPPPSSVKHPDPPGKAGEAEGGRRRAPGEAGGESVGSRWIP